MRRLEYYESLAEDSPHRDNVQEVESLTDLALELGIPAVPLPAGTIDSQVAAIQAQKKCP